MSVILKRFVGACALAAILAGCSGGALPVSGGAEAPGGGKRSFFGGPVVTPPTGYCFAETGEAAPQGFFVILPCDEEENAVTPAVISVQYGQNGSAIIDDNAAALPAFVESEDGRALLSASGKAASVEVEAVSVEAGVARVLLRDADAIHDDVLSNREWRGFFDFRNRLVSVSVREFRSQPLDEKTAAKLMTLALSVARGGV